MHKADVANLHRLLIGIKNLKVSGGRAERSKNSIEGKRIGTKGKTAVAELFFATTAIAKQEQCRYNRYNK